MFNLRKIDEVVCVLKIRSYIKYAYDMPQRNAAQRRAGHNILLSALSGSIASVLHATDRRVLKCYERPDAKTCMCLRTQTWNMCAVSSSMAA